MEVVNNDIEVRVAQYMKQYALQQSVSRDYLAPLPCDDAVVSVPQRIYSFSRGGDPHYKRYLETLGLSTCIGLTVYDPKTKIGCIAHLDNDNGIKPASHDMESPFLLKVANDFKRFNSPGPYHLRIVGGWRGISEHTLLPLFETLHYLDPFEVVELAALEPMPWGSQVLSVILDLEDGMLYNSSARQRFNNEEVERISRILLDMDFTGIYVPHRDLRGL